MDERGVPVCARGENRRSVWVASGSERGVIGSDRVSYFTFPLMGFPISSAFVLVEYFLMLMNRLLNHHLLVDFF